MKFSIYILFLFGFTAAGFAQNVKPDSDIKLYYRSSVAYGFILHTAGSSSSIRHPGIGGSFKYQKHISFKHKRFYNFEFVNLKHPKQEKIQNNFYPDSKSFYYGKINSLVNTRFGFGNQKAVALKEIKKGVQIAWTYNAGLALGFMKPNYVRISDVDGIDQVIEVRYDPSIHSLGDIRGRGSALSGLGQMEVVPGIFGKLALNFEYSPYDERLKGIEVGVAADVFYKEIPLMYNTRNNQYWITFYLMFEFGKKIE